MALADTLRLLSLAAIWSSSFIFIRVLAPVLGPIVTAEFRVLFAGIALVIYFSILRFNAEWKKNWKHYLVIGGVNSALPFALYSFAGLHVPASYSVILNSTAPLFGAVFSALWLGSDLSAKKIAGLLLGAAGVVLVTKVGPAGVDSSFALAVAACLGAASCYGLGGIYIKKFASRAKPLGIAGGSQVFAALLLLPLIPFSPVRSEITGLVVLNVLGLSLLCSAVAYILYFRLISDVGPTKALTVTFLMPAFGVVWGSLFLGETITLEMIAGCALIVSGTAFVVKN